MSCFGGKSIKGVNRLIFNRNRLINGCQCGDLECQRITPDHLMDRVVVERHQNNFYGVGRCFCIQQISTQ